jgi:hypothetical protein
MGMACAASRGPASLEGPQTALIAPVGFDQQLEEPLRPGIAVVQEVMSTRLEQRGLSVRAPARDDFLAVWRTATQDIGALYDAKGVIDPGLQDTAARALAKAYRERGDRFGVLLLSYLTVASFPINSGSVSWDGVERRVRVDRRGGNHELKTWPNHRVVPCVSLRVLAYSADGDRLFETRGGLEIASEFRLRDLREDPRKDLFEDRSAVSEGVEIALRPLFSE